MIPLLLADGEGAMAEGALLILLASVALLVTASLGVVWLRTPRPDRRAWKLFVYLVVALFSAYLIKGLLFAPNYLTLRL